MSVHTTADDPKRYRTDEQVEAELRDPITQFQYLRAKDLLDDASLVALEEEIDREIAGCRTSREGDGRNPWTHWQCSAICMEVLTLRRRMSWRAS